uniref:Uncharacterized protein n=1 Tax=Thermosporothrix sp. COM3 TaxID=2490863 RepID=A0A455T205_9CHLR|nr:hypothetical protein KTC_61450 [Thermosporothrix sp. COM3]
MYTRTTVVGVFTDRTQADYAIEQLQNAGFTNEQIGFIARNPETGDTVTESGAEAKATATAAGAVGGGVVGGVVGAGIALLIPGIGPAIAGGVLAATLGGVAIGAVAGGLIGALTNMGIPADEARYYQEEIEAGRTLVTVKAGDRYQDALTILRQNGAYVRTDNEVQQTDQNDVQYTPENQVPPYQRPMDTASTEPGPVAYPGGTPLGSPDYTQYNEPAPEKMQPAHYEGYTPEKQTQTTNYEGYTPSEKQVPAETYSHDIPPVTERKEHEISKRDLTEEEQRRRSTESPYDRR